MMEYLECLELSMLLDMSVNDLRRPIDEKCFHSAVLHTTLCDKCGTSCLLTHCWLLLKILAITSTADKTCFTDIGMMAHLCNFI